MDSAKSGFDPKSIPDWYMSQLRMEIMQDMVRDGANEASVKLQSEIMAAEKVDPVLQFATKLIVETWLITHGFRMIEDASITSSIRKQMEEQNQRKEAGLLTKIADVISGRSEKTRTELIEQNEALAAINEGIKNENVKVQLETAEARRQASEMVNEASKNAFEIVRNATLTSDELLKNTRAEAERLTRTTETTINDQNTIIKRLQGEINQKREILVELNSNPDVIEVYRKINSDSESLLRSEISNQIETIKYQLFKLNESKSPGLPLKKQIVAECLKGYQLYVLGNLKRLEEQFSPEKRSLLVPGIIMELTRAVNDQRNVNMFSNHWNFANEEGFSVSFFSRFLRRLIDANVSIDEMITEFNENFQAFIEASGDLPKEALREALKEAYEISKPPPKK